MPKLPRDVHAAARLPGTGEGGSVIAMRQALAPAAVGVDIVCGMSAVRTNLTVEDLAEQTAGVECRKDAGVVDEHRRTTDARPIRAVASG